MMMMMMRLEEKEKEKKNSEGGRGVRRETLNGGQWIISFHHLPSAVTLFLRCPSPSFALPLLPSFSCIKGIRKKSLAFGVTIRFHFPVDNHSINLVFVLSPTPASGLTPAVTPLV